MSKLLSIFAAVAMLTALPAQGFAATDVANSSNSKYCAPGAPEGYQRPGGFCDQLDDLKSLVDNDACATVADAGFRFDEVSGRLLVATPIDPCCKDAFNMELALPSDGMLVADRCR